MDIILELQNISKDYYIQKHQLQVLKDVNLRVNKDEVVTILGPSGSGKSTLLTIAAGLDKPTSGSIELLGQDITLLSEKELTSIRAHQIGFVFQNFQLVKHLTALENIALPLLLESNLSEKEILERAKNALSDVGLSDRATHFPGELSGGEEQRVAIARSFIHEPKILFADEPTANLDPGTGQEIIQLLLKLNKEKGSTLILVTHDANVAKVATSSYKMDMGHLVKLKNLRRKKSK